ncbi:MAG TPA: thioredoxin domain-containing protein [Trueperaceae bacterium]
MIASGPRLSVPVSERDHSQGPAGAPVTLVEYGDYECSSCGAAYPIVKDVQRRLGERLRFVFRNFPIRSSHPHAESAAEAAEAAGAQGKFWEMHDLLYEHQDALDDAHLRDFALQVGLDVVRFERDVSEHRFAERVQEDFLGGARSGVNGTPTFFIDGVRYDGSWDEAPLVSALERAAR